MTLLFFSGAAAAGAIKKASGDNTTLRIIGLDFAEINKWRSPCLKGLGKIKEGACQVYEF